MRFHMLAAAGGAGTGLLFEGIILLCFAVVLFLHLRLRKRCEYLESRIAEAEAEKRELRGKLQTLEDPADAIIGYSGLARRDGVTDAEKNEYLEMIEEAGRELVSAVREEERGL